MTTKADPTTKADLDTLSLAELFLNRRGITIVRTAEGSNHRNLYVEKDSAKGVLSVYSKGALLVGGSTDGLLHQVLQAFVNAVGAKPHLGLASSVERERAHESDVVARLETLEGSVAEIRVAIQLPRSSTL